jgi:regulator of sigma D
VGSAPIAVQAAVESIAPWAHVLSCSCITPVFQENYVNIETLIKFKKHEGSLQSARRALSFCHLLLELNSSGHLNLTQRLQQLNLNKLKNRDDSGSKQQQIVNKITRRFV